ncbi:MAG: hypothetical protein ABJF01_07435 [bacterium]
MRRAFVVLPLIALTACESPSVEWTDPVALGQAGAATRLIVDTGGNAHFAAEAASPAALPTAAGLCVSSVRTAVGSAHVYAVWWSVRPDSSARLEAASSPDFGKTWGTATAVDTSDVSSNGCRRPPPAVAVVGDDLHLAYSMVAPEGTGVFFAHFMSSMLHSPVAVIYGERLVSTAIAADAERVAVAYEEPNGTRRQVDVAISSSQGHIFEWHATASRDIDMASQPAVALAGHHLAVAWTTQRTADSTSTHVVRSGQIR